jgi:uncharacterized protein (DUF1330 family)
VTNPERFAKEYSSKVEATFLPFGGQYLSRGAKVVEIDGKAPERLTILGFDSAQKAAEWRKSAAFQALIPARDASAKVQSFAVDAEVKR